MTGSNVLYLHQNITSTDEPVLTYRQKERHILRQQRAELFLTTAEALVTALIGVGFLTCFVLFFQML